MTHPQHRAEKPVAAPDVPSIAAVSNAASATLTPPPATALLRPAARRGTRPGTTQASHASANAPDGAVTIQSRRLTVEGALYLLFILAAALTRFWDLGKRALHHDESLHAYYSWILVQGDGYRHDPLMHGPFLFEANALIYFLFGDSDATSRYLPALTGVLLVAAPWLLRSPRLLGRVGALTASLLLLISPSFFYYTRYIRHDPYTALGSLLLFTCIVRYRERPERRWLVGGGLTLAFLFANHEIVFALVAIFGGFVWGALLWGQLRPLLSIQLAAAALAGSAVILIRRFVDEPLPAIPWDNPTGAAQRQFYADLVTHPLTVALLVIGIVFLAACWWTLQDERRRRDGVGLLDGAPEGSTEAAIRAAGRDVTGLSIVVIAALAIFVALFTTFFTNLDGLASGTFATDGTLLYWLGQQEEQRGSQPWFFYLVLAPQYEFLAIVLGLLGVGLTLWRAASARATAAPRLFVRLFLTTWFLLIFAGLSYAGEKMPWLLMHITLPAVLLGATVVDDLAHRWWTERTARTAGPVPGRRAPGWTGAVFVGGLLVTGATWFLLAGRLTYGEFEPTADGGLVRTVTSDALDRWWLLALPALAGVVLLGASWLWRGSRTTGRNALVAVVLLLALLQVHVAWRLTYLQGDTPVDMLMYNQTSPDVTRMMAEVGALSNELTGGKDLVVWYDGFTAWPMQWYLRDYPNRHYYAEALTGPPELNGTPADVLIVANANIGSVEEVMAGYTAQEYVLRWHFPEEETYRNFAIAPELDPSDSAWRDPNAPHGPVAVAESVANSVGTQLQPEGQQRVYRLVMYRDLPVIITGYNYTIYVRDDLLPLFNTVRY